MTSDEILVPSCVYHTEERAICRCEGCQEILYDVTRAEYYLLKDKRFKNIPPHTVTDCLKSLKRRVNISESRQ